MIGIVAEGPADVAVVRNILKGKLGIDRDLTWAIRPELAEDATDLGRRGGYREPRPEEFSNWAIVLEACRTRTQIADFLQSQIDDDGFVVVQIDTAEAHLPGYDVDRPDRTRADYTDALRALVVEKIDALLGPDLAPGVRHAIAVEETDAWVLAIHDDQDRRDTGARIDPKKRLRFVIDRKAPRGKAKAGRRKDDDYHDLSRDFRDPGRLEACASRSRSLRLFLDALAPPPEEG